MKSPQIVVVGSFVQDLAFQSELLPKPGETRIGTFRTGPGGKGFNQAIAAHRQEVTTAFIGASGKDLFAAAIREFIKNEGLAAYLLEIPNESTGTAAILVESSGQNSIVVALGANNFLTPAFVLEHSELFKEKPVTLVQAECNLDASRAALKLGRAARGITILNPAPINPAINRETLQMADILTPNETEFQFLMKSLFNVDVTIDLLSLPLSELHTLANKLHSPTVVITLGAHGAFVSHNPEVNPGSARDYRDSEEHPFYVVPSVRVKAIDTTGAGDAFSGGLAAGLVRHPESFQMAVKYASVVAGLSTESVGTAPSMPTRAMVASRIR